MLNYPGNTAPTRNKEFRKVINAINPDILVVQEMTSQSGATQFRDSVLNRYVSGKYSASAFHDGPDTDNEIYYRSDRASFLGATYIATALRDIAHYRVQSANSSEVLHIYSVHLKAGATSSDQTERLAEATILRDSLNSLPAGSHFIVVGDYNIQRSSETAFQELVGSQVNNNGQCFDPLNLVGTWNNNAAFAPYHTQSSRVRSLSDGGATGGMDDRFDIILISSSLQTRNITSSYTAFGNDGNHLNDSINRLPNSAVPDSIAIALHYSSDHIPAYEDFLFLTSALPIQLGSFTGTFHTNTGVVDLRWVTLSELNNYGFEVQRRPAQTPTFLTIPNSFVPGHGTTVVPQYYTYTDSNAAPGRWYYRLKQIDLDGSVHFSDAISIEIVTSVSTETPFGFSLSQNFPNPFNPSTTIIFTLPNENFVNISVFDILGREVKTLLNDWQTSGTHGVEWDGTNFEGRSVASGIYTYRISASTTSEHLTFVRSRTMVLVR